MASKIDLHDLFRQVDEFGNYIILRNNGDMFLYLKGQPARNIGNIKAGPDGQIVYSKFMKATNIYRKSNSWGFSRTAIEALPDYALLQVHTDTGKTYSIRADKAREVGERYMSSGFERQLLVPIREFTCV